MDAGEFVVVQLVPALHCLVVPETQKSVSHTGRLSLATVRCASFARSLILVSIFDAFAARKL